MAENQGNEDKMKMLAKIGEQVRNEGNKVQPSGDNPFASGAGPAAKCRFVLRRWHNGSTHCGLLSRAVGFDVKVEEGFCDACAGGGWNSKPLFNCQSLIDHCKKLLGDRFIAGGGPRAQVACPADIGDVFDRYVLVASPREAVKLLRAALHAQLMVPPEKGGESVPVVIQKLMLMARKHDLLNEAFVGLKMVDALDSVRASVGPLFGAVFAVPPSDKQSNEKGGDVNDLAVYDHLLDLSEKLKIGGRLDAEAGLDELSADQPVSVLHPDERTVDSAQKVESVPIEMPEVPKTTVESVAVDSFFDTDECEARKSCQICRDRRRIGWRKGILRLYPATEGGVNFVCPYGLPWGYKR